MVTLKDVANEAGVSDRTVSRVVHNDKRVDPMTRARVNEAIDRLGYIPNRAAVMMRNNRSDIIGVITDVVSTTPYSTDIIRGIQSAVEAHGFSILTVNTAGNPEQISRCWRELKGHRVDGVIYVTMFQRHLEPWELDPDMPTILVNCHAPAGSDTPTILPDEIAGMAQAVEAAVAAGHNSFGYVRLNSSVMAAGIREQALKEALSHHGQPLRPDWCVKGAEGPVFKDQFTAFDTARDLLKNADRPSVLFCGNDQIALQVFSAACSLGLHVPSDLSIVGFDDFTVISEVIRPSLTTVALPYFEMGREAVSALTQRLRGEDVNTHSWITCHFIRRNSLVPPAGLTG